MLNQIFESLNIIDYLIITFLLFTAIRGFFRGLIRCLLDIFAIFSAIFIAIYWFDDLARFINNLFKLPEQVAIILCFILLFGLTIFAFVFIGNLIHGFIGKSILGPINAIGGAIFGILKGLLILWFIITIFLSLPFPGQIKVQFLSSKSIVFLEPLLKNMDNVLYYFNPDSIDKLDKLFEKDVIKIIRKKSQKNPSKKNGAKI